MTDLSTFCFAGYFITKRTPWPRWSTLNNKPASILSASDCLVGMFPDDWAYDWATMDDATRLERAAKMGIGGTGLEIAVRLVTGFEKEAKIGWLHCIRDWDAVKALWSLAPVGGNWQVLGLALKEGDVAGFLSGCAPGERTAMWGVYAEILQKKTIPRGGTILGFEPVGFEESGHCHSWLCNDFEGDFHRELGVVPNEFGLISSEDQAEAGAKYIRRDGSGAEPGLWQSWLLLDYAAQVSQKER